MPRTFKVNLPEDLLRNNLFRVNEDYYNPSMEKLARALAADFSEELDREILKEFCKAQNRKTSEPRHRIVIVGNTVVFSTFENGYHLCMATVDEVVKRFDEMQAEGFTYIQLVCFQILCKAEIVTPYNQKLLVQGFRVRDGILIAGCMRFSLDYLLPKISQMREVMAQELP